MKAGLIWADTLCQLNSSTFALMLPQLLERAAQQGVNAILMPSITTADCTQLKTLASTHCDQIPGLVYTLGIHPLYVDQVTEDDLVMLQKQIEHALPDPRFVGLGEIGLDYFVAGGDVAKQEFIFRAQLDIAEQFQLPVVLHSRRAHDQILKALRLRAKISGVVHAFNGSIQQAEQFIGLGFKLSFGGAATYARALQIRRLLEELPLESLLIETDAPDMPPSWLKEQDGLFNEPAYLPRIAQELSNIRNVPIEEFSKAVWGNTMQAFPRWSALMANISNPPTVS